MILNFKKSKDFLNLFFILKELNHANFNDLYLTKNNERVYINNTKEFKELLSKSHNIFFEDSELGKGIIMIWKAFSGEVERNYIKFVSSDIETLKRLLSMMLWNYNKQLFIKIKKDSPYIKVFREKGFKFLGGRGSQILMEKNKSLGEKLNVNIHNKD